MSILSFQHLPCSPVLQGFSVVFRVYLAVLYFHTETFQKMARRTGRWKTVAASPCRLSSRRRPLCRLDYYVMCYYSRLCYTTACQDLLYRLLDYICLDYSMCCISCTFIATRRGGGRCVGPPGHLRCRPQPTLFFILLSLYIYIYICIMILMIIMIIIVIIMVIIMIILLYNNTY